MKHGMLIALEGGEGAGKSTQARLLADSLREAGHDVVLTREPGGTALGAKIRSVLLDPGEAPAPLAELLLYAADRAHHVEKVIRPALLGGKVVITDRYVGSTVAYQGYGRGRDFELIDQLNHWSTGGLMPHLTILLDVYPDVGVQRAIARGQVNRFETEDMGFHHRVRKGFLNQASAHTWTTISGERPEEQVAQQVLLIAARELQWMGHRTPAADVAEDVTAALPAMSGGRDGSP